MAKQTKSGLGRGLSTLIGGSFGESAPKTQKPERQRVTIEPGEIPDYDPILEPSTMRAAPHPPKSVTPPKPEAKPSQPAPTSSESANASSDKDESSPDSAVDQSQPDKKTPRTLVSQHTNDDETQSAIDVDNVDTVPIDRIDPNPNQPRTNFDNEELEELATSIDREGLLQPILVRRVNGDKYQIVAGERRWQACKMAGLKEVPVILKDVDEDKAIELALIENLQRSDLNPIEEAYGYRRLMDRKRWTQAQLALAMSKGRSTIANALRLLDLPEDAQQLLFEEKITAGHARAILSIPSAEGRQKLTEKLKNEKLTVREAENIARLMSYHDRETKQATRTVIPDAYKRVAKALRDVLNTTVRVRSSKGKNRIEIDFADEAELDRIFEGLIAAQDEA